MTLAEASWFAAGWQRQIDESGAAAAFFGGLPACVREYLSIALVDGHPLGYAGRCALLQASVEEANRRGCPGSGFTSSSIRQPGWGVRHRTHLIFGRVLFGLKLPSSAARRVHGTLMSSEGAADQATGRMRTWNHPFDVRSYAIEPRALDCLGCEIAATRVPSVDRLAFLLRCNVMPTTTALPRTYFTVVDEAGKAAPAVEYWAAHFDESVENHEILPLRRFLILLGSGESLVEIDQGIFETEGSGKRLYRLRD